MLRGGAVLDMKSLVNEYLLEKKARKNKYDFGEPFMDGHMFARTVR